MPVYNGERFLREAVESVLVQTLEDLELIIVNDGSTDGTADILHECAAADTRVVVESQANAGSAAARNRGFGLARARLVALLDADDVAMPERLEIQRGFLDAHDAVAAVGGAVAFIDDEGRTFAEWRYPLSNDEITSAFASAMPIAHPSVMLRASAFEAVRGYRPLFVASEDMDLLLRLHELYEVANVPDFVLGYRLHSAHDLQRVEVQTLESLAARFSARARRDGHPDPLDSVEQIDRRALHRLGITDEEFTTAFVRNSTWLGKLTAGAGYARTSEELFVRAGDQARSKSGSPALVAAVQRAHAGALRERGRAVRAAVMRLRARRSALQDALGSRLRESRP
jgi:glycosyltransferase involved in cell wall biosynthesis